jgi:hypothetical protein
LDVRTGSREVAEAISGLGEELFNLGQKYDLKQANTQLSEAVRQVEDARIKRDIALSGELDPEKYDAIQQQFMREVEGYRPENKRAAEAFSLHVNKKSPIWQREVLDSKVERADDNFDAEITTDISNLARGIGDVDSIKDKIATGYKIDKDTNLPVDKSKYVTLILMANEAYRKGQMENAYSAAIIPGMSKGWSLATKQDGYDIINANPILTDEEKRKVLNKLDTRYSGEITASSKNAYIKSLNTTKSLISGLVDNTLTPDSVESLNLNKDMEELWLGEDGYLRGSSDLPPSETTTIGYKTMNELITDFSNNKMSSLDAYQEALDARYIDRTITDADFQKLIGKIEKPYPAPLAKMVESIVSKRREAFKQAETWGWFFYTDAEKARVEAKTQAVNNQLFDWIDKELEKNKNRTFTPEELYEMKAQIEVTTKPPEPPSQPSPYVEYPDAFMENGVWKVIRDGLKYRIQE